MTKSVPIRICAAMLLSFSIVGGRALFVVGETRRLEAGPLWLHVLRGVAPFVLASLWLLFVSPASRITCAVVVALQGLWLILSTRIGVFLEDSAFSLTLGVIFCIPAAIEGSRFVRKRTQDRDGLP